MSYSADPWSIVLAAGEGKRLQSLTLDAGGVATPKQFCSLYGGSTLLGDALLRAEAVAPRERICTVVAAQHERWWHRDLGDRPPANVLVQPANRGTGNGILLPLLHVLRRDPDATVVLLPSDHHVCDECALACELRAAARAARDTEDGIVLLGISPDEADVELGYIVPQGERAGGLRSVARFVEKPSAPVAQSLIARGALWNSFIVAATARGLLSLFERKIPQIVARMRRALHRDAYRTRGGPALAGEYAELHTLDFSRHLLDGAESMLRVKAVPACGWTDLGTPRRIAATLQRRPDRLDVSMPFDDRLGRPCLAARHRREAALAGSAALR